MCNRVSFWEGKSILARWCYCYPQPELFAVCLCIPHLPYPSDFLVHFNTDHPTVSVLQRFPMVGATWKVLCPTPNWWILRVCPSSMSLILVSARKDSSYPLPFPPEFCRSEPHEALKTRTGKFLKFWQEDLCPTRGCLKEEHSGFRRTQVRSLGS